MSHTTTFSADFAAREAPHATLDELAAQSDAELLGRYRRGRLPADLGEVAGEPVGRMLAVRGAEGALFEALRGLAAWRRFPWEGKTFEAKGEGRGAGINRVRLGALRMNWFPFETRVEPSVVDGQPCIYLDYAQPGNPWFIAKIRDEIREVAPGLYLGPAMWKDGRGGAAHVLWFAVDFRARR